jgi:hypothetical protein
MRVSISACLAALLAASALHAETTNVTAQGFEVHTTVHVKAPTDKAFAALIVPARWWDSAHTFSHDAANLTLEPQAGGCWCEKLPNGGSVEHLHVLYVAPGAALRLRGALGPFQGMALDGVMTFVLKPVDGGSDITVTYLLGGYSKDGFESAAKAVDQVMSEQLAHLKQLLDG